MYRDKVAVVTGGASGIGREMCLYLPATVAVPDKSDLQRKNQTP